MFDIFLCGCMLFACVQLCRIANELENAGRQLERIGDDIEAME